MEVYCCIDTLRGVSIPGVWVNRERLINACAYVAMYVVMCGCFEPAVAHMYITFLCEWLLVAVANKAVDCGNRGAWDKGEQLGTCVHLRWFQWVPSLRLNSSFARGDRRGRTLTPLLTCDLNK